MRLILKTNQLSNRLMTIGLRFWFCKQVFHKIPFLLQDNDYSEAIFVSLGLHPQTGHSLKISFWTKIISSVAASHPQLLQIILKHVSQFSFFIHYAASTLTSSKDSPARARLSQLSHILHGPQSTSRPQVLQGPGWSKL